MNKQWLTLGQASELLGVHPATLRTWADEGHIRVFRTPGGHRRFLLSDVEALLAPEKEPSAALALSTPIQLGNAINHIRHDLAQPDVAEEEWIASLPQNERQPWQASGQKLLSLALQYVARRRGHNAVLTEASEIAHRHAQMCVDHDIRITDLVRASLFFRNSVQTAICPQFGTEGSHDEEDTRIHHELSEFFDLLLHKMLDAYDQVCLRESE